MAEAEIVPLHGNCIDTGAVCEEIVAFLQGYLDEAKRGEVKGIALTVVQGNNNIVTQWCGGRADRHFLLAGAGLLQHRLTVEIFND